MLILKGDGASTQLPGNMPAGMRPPPEQAAAEVGPAIRSTRVCFRYVCHVCYMCMPSVYAMCSPFVLHVYPLYMSCEYNAYSMCFRRYSMRMPCHVSPSTRIPYVCHAMCIPYVRHP